MFLIERRKLFALFAFLAFASGVAAQSPPSTPAAVLAAAKSWGYQLQNIRPLAIAGAPYDLLVIDYSADGSDAQAFSVADIAALKTKPDGGRRIVLAYLSIGEAETYRYYWQPEWNAHPPSWLADANKRYRTNIVVRYWEEAWQGIIFRGENNYLDRIIAAGFDGVYLDRVDSYQEFEQGHAAARPDMMAFVKALAAQARSRRPGFLVVPQNAEELLDNTAYRAAIDGIAKEDLLFGEGHSKEPNPQKVTDEGVRSLKRMTRDRKPVFVVEYLDKPEDIVAARKQIESYGFIPHFADRRLDVMRLGDLPPTRSGNR
jgi:cysteinyl-tRNA synthetase, unknown class